MELEEVLRTDNGQKYFMEFLKKEYSQENLEFWQECQKFKLIKNKKQLKKSCEKIYVKFISQNSANAVNIDSAARRMVENNLRKPTVEIFNLAESQIFQLMQTDSFSRFKNSDLFGKLLESMGLSEKENNTTPLSSRKRKLLSAKMPVVYENDFVNKNAKLSYVENSSDIFANHGSQRQFAQDIGSIINLNNIEANNQFLFADDDENVNCDTESLYCNAPIYSMENVYEKIDSSSHTSSGTSLMYPPVSVDNYHQNQQSRFVRFLFPDCSEEYIPLNQNVPIRKIVDNLLENKKMLFSSYKLFAIQTNENIEADLNIFELEFGDVRVEQRVAFYIHFPEGYQIEVETIPHQLAFHTLKTILLHFGITFKDIEMYYNHGKRLNEAKLMNPTFNLDQSNIFIKYLSSLRTYLNFKDLSYLNEDGICIKSIKFEEYNQKACQQSNNCKSSDTKSKRNKLLPIKSFSSFTVDNNFPFAAISSCSKIPLNDPIEHTYVNEMKNIDLADLSFSSDHKTDQFLADIMANDNTKFNFVCTPNKAKPLPNQFNTENCYENVENNQFSNKISTRDRVEISNNNNNDKTHKARFVIIDDNEYENVGGFSIEPPPPPPSTGKKEPPQCTCSLGRKVHRNDKMNSTKPHRNRTILQQSPSVSGRLESPFRKYLLQSAAAATVNRSNSCKQFQQSNQTGTSRSIQSNRYSTHLFSGENSTPTLNRPDIITSNSSNGKFNRIQTLAKFHKIN